MTMKTALTVILMILPLAARADQVFSLVLPECESRLERRSADDEVAIVRTPCHLSLPSLAKLLDAGLREWFPGDSLPLRGVYLGRLMDYPDWSRALAGAAAKAKSWNKKRGRPSKTGESDNRSVQLLLNGPAYPQPLAPVFARYGLSACIGDVEKVLVFQVKEIRGDLAKTASGNARLPVDGQIWLTLKPLSKGCGD
ncbi:hypothetical protein ACH518_14280 [Methylomonas sp. HW2-6]|uniref:hypothetical protein n=1 Tax=Methylomonas sp. HW2-6 TaxID=3376687 RepID=UPI00404124EF